MSLSRFADPPIPIPAQTAVHPQSDSKAAQAPWRVIFYPRYPQGLFAPSPYSVRGQSRRSHWAELSGRTCAPGPQTHSGAMALGDEPEDGTTPGENQTSAHSMSCCQHLARFCFSSISIENSIDRTLFNPTRYQGRNQWGRDPGGRLNSCGNFLYHTTRRSDVAQTHASAETFGHPC